MAIQKYEPMPEKALYKHEIVKLNQLPACLHCERKSTNE